LKGGTLPHPASRTMNKDLLYQNKKIFYRSEGVGEPVLFVHGFGENGEVWKDQIEFLKVDHSADETEFKLIIPDLPGSGIRND